MPSFPTSLFAAVNRSEFSIVGRQLLIDAKPFILKGVCYNPVAKGRSHPDNQTIDPKTDDLKTIEKDFKMMKEAGLNTLRTYVPIRDRSVLDLMSKYGLYQIVPVLLSTRVSRDDVKETVLALKDHPTTLMWQVGNEWNYNKLYDDSISFEEAKDIVKETGTLIRSLDRSHPLMTNYGELPAKELVDELSGFDIWSLNIYSGKSFGNRFERWKAISSKPMFLGEFGADAINVNKLDLESQRIATKELLAEIKSNLSARGAAKVLLGASIFSWTDGWWKDPKGSDFEQDLGGNAPGGGPYPDGIFHEEYWGIVTIDRVIRPAYTEVGKAWRDL